MIDPEDIEKVDYWIEAQFRGARCDAWERIKNQLIIPSHNKEIEIVPPNCDCCKFDSGCDEMYGGENCKKILKSNESE